MQNQGGKKSIKPQKPAWPDNAIYFLTDACFLHFPYFKTDEQKQILLDQIIKVNKRLGTPISDYSIAVNHYHIKFYLDDSKKLPQIKQFLRGGTAYAYRRQYEAPYKEMWQSRKILIVRNKKMDRLVSGYIIGNLLKHKEVGTFRELKKNRFSSYWYMADKYGESEMQRLVRSVIKVDEDSYGHIDVERFI